MGAIRQIIGHVWSHPANRGRRCKAVLRAVTWQVYKRTVGGHWTVRVPGGLRLRCYPDSMSGGRMLYANGHPDWHEMWFVRRYLRAGDGFLDVGANIGAYTLLAAPIIGPAGRIEAFEAGARTAERLKENVSLNGLAIVRVHEAAAGAEPGVVRFTQGQDTTNHIATQTQAGEAVAEVPCVRLDDAVGTGRFSLAKIDVEGAEPLVLRGSQRLLAERNPPVWLLELSAAIADFGHTHEGIRDWLSERGYGLYLYDADQRRLRAEQTPWHERGNVLAIANDQVEFVKTRLGGG